MRVPGCEVIPKIATCMGFRGYMLPAGSSGYKGLNYYKALYLMLRNQITSRKQSDESIKSMVSLFLVQRSARAYALNFHTGFISRISIRDEEKFPIQLKLWTILPSKKDIEKSIQNYYFKKENSGIKRYFTMYHNSDFSNARHSFITNRVQMSDYYDPEN